MKIKGQGETQICKEWNRK